MTKADIIEQIIAQTGIEKLQGDHGIACAVSSSGSRLRITLDISTPDYSKLPAWAASFFF